MERHCCCSSRKGFCFVDVIMSKDPQDRRIHSHKIQSCELPISCRGADRVLCLIQH